MQSLRDCGINVWYGADNNGKEGCELDINVRETCYPALESLKEILSRILVDENLKRVSIDRVSHIQKVYFSEDNEKQVQKDIKELCDRERDEFHEYVKTVDRELYARACGRISNLKECSDIIENTLYDLPRLVAAIDMVKEAIGKVISEEMERLQNQKP